MSHPFENIPARKRLAALWILSAATILLLTVLGTLYGPLKNQTAPQGMVSLELAGTQARVTQMLASWSEGVRMGVAFSLGLNFLCLFTLTNALALACVASAEAARRFGGAIFTVGMLLAWGQWVAGVCWGVENSLLAAAVLGYGADFGVAVAFWLAALKFALVGAGLLYAVLMGIGAGVWRGPSR